MRAINPRFFCELHLVFPPGDLPCSRHWPRPQANPHIPEERSLFELSFIALTPWVAWRRRSTPLPC
jgi:hypothetical protein